MPRYIDAYKIPYHDLSDEKGLCQVAFLEDIVKVPTADVVEVVRCKDCVKREICRTTTIWAVHPDNDWFCADGKRKL